MISLFISTATKKIIVGIIKDGKLIHSVNEVNDNTLSSRIMSIIDDVFTNTNINPENVDKIYVVNGPGSFTGIRVGVTIAKVMAWSLNKKIYTISSLEMLASINKNEELIIPLIDARRGYVFAGIYNNNLELIGQERHILLNDLLKELDNKKCLFVSEDEFEFDTCPSEYDILKLIKKHENDKEINPHLVNPNYLKLTEAEENLKAKNDN